MSFKFDDIEVASSDFKPTITPGIHNVIILGYESQDDWNFIKLKFANLEGTREVFIKLHTSDELKEGKKKTAIDVALANVSHIAIACLTDAERRALTANTKEDLLYIILEAIKGRKLRMKFVGREFISKDGSVKVITEIGFPNFAENISVPDGETILRFDPKSNYDMKRLPSKPSADSGASPTTSGSIFDSPMGTKADDDDMPF